MDRAPPLVLHVIHHLVTGGMENGLVNLLNRMPQSRFRHAIVCIEGMSEFRSRLTRSDVDVMPLARAQIGVWGVRRQIYGLCRRLRPAIVHTRNLSGLDALAPAFLAGVRHRIHGEHGWDVGDLQGKKLRPRLLRRIHAPLVDRYVTVSQDLAKYLVQGVGIAPTRITTICNGVDLSRFSPGPKRDRRAVPEHMRADDLYIFGTVGRMQPVKNQMALLDAFARIVRSGDAFGTRLRLVIVGGGPLLAPLRRKVEALGLEHMIWMPGDVTNVADILRALDVFVLPSLNEGISNTLLEAMASGLPAIATRVGGNPELVVDGQTGILVDPQEPAALEGPMQRYAGDVHLARTHGRAARGRAERHFGIDTMVAKYAELYENVLGIEPGSTRSTPSSARDPVSFRSH